MKSFSSSLALWNNNQSFYVETQQKTIKFKSKSTCFWYRL